MRKGVGSVLAVWLVLFAAGCGATPVPPAEEAGPAERAAETPSGTGRLTVHVKDMTKILNLV
jgi:hypothetical protein